MVETLRGPISCLPAGLGYNVFSGDWLIGRIYERGGFTDKSAKALMNRSGFAGGSNS